MCTPLPVLILNDECVLYYLRSLQSIVLHPICPKQELYNYYTHPQNLGLWSESSTWKETKGEEQGRDGWQNHHFASKLETHLILALVISWCHVWMFINFGQHIVQHDILQSVYIIYKLTHLPSDDYLLLLCSTSLHLLGTGSSMQLTWTIIAWKWRWNALHRRLLSNCDCWHVSMLLLFQWLVIANYEFEYIWVWRESLYTWWPL